MHDYPSYNNPLEDPDPYQYWQGSYPYKEPSYPPQGIGLTKSAAKAIENSESADYTLIVAGVTGSGKSTFCNYLFQEEVFKSKCGAIAVTSKSDGNICSILGKNLYLIDTPGFADEFNSNEQRIADLSSAVLMAKDGIHGVILCFDGSKRFDTAVGSTLRELRQLGKGWWKYAFVVYTHADQLGNTTQRQRTEVQSWLKSSSCPDELKNLFHSIDGRFMTIDSKKEWSDRAYYNEKCKELLSMVQKIMAKERNKVYTNELFLLAKEQYDNAKKEKEEKKLELENAFKKLKELEEKEAKKEREIKIFKDKIANLEQNERELERRLYQLNEGTAERKHLQAQIDQIKAEKMAYLERGMEEGQSLKDLQSNVHKINCDVSFLKGYMQRPVSEDAYDGVKQEVEKKPGKLKKFTNWLGSFIS